jgi:hypothetical protein
MKLPAFIDGFFFARIASRGFSVMRIAWAFITGAFLLMNWHDVWYYYSEAGMYPHAIEDLYVRHAYRFTILDWVDQPSAVFCLYLILLVTLLCMMIGYRTRLMTIVSVLLLFSFHERNPMILGGGDTLLRNIGFLLMIAQGIDGFSITRLQKQLKFWKRRHELLRSVTMPIWPWRLLLWQMIVLYATSLWYKLLGTMWLNGTAVEATFHHPVYARFSPAITNWLMPTMGLADYLALFWQFSWLLLLIPQRFLGFPLRRLLIFGGILFHGGILLLMDAGVFSLAIFVAYLGLLRDEDIAWLKKILQSPFSNLHSPIIVLYDGHCGLCLRSIFALELMDWFKVLKPVDFRNLTLRKEYAPDLSIRDLDRAMHILYPKKLEAPFGKAQGRLHSKLEALTGFDAFRYIAGRLPLLWILEPFLYLPGATSIGRHVYGKIAMKRKKCDHKSCRI